MYKSFIILLLFIYISNYALGQIALNKVSKIVILDYVNWNYETVNSIEYEIHVKNNFTLLKTGRIPKAQFVQEKLKAQSKALKRKLHKLEKRFYRKKDTLARKKSRVISTQFWTKVDSAYKDYNQKLKSKKIGKIDSSLMKKLVIALNSHPILIDSLCYPLDKWIKNNKKEIKNYLLKEEKKLSLEEIDTLVRSYKYETIPKLEFLDTMMVQDAYRFYQFYQTSYYPTISITLYTTDKDTLYFENTSQSTPPLPWVLYKKNSEKTFYNLEINDALYQILPKKAKINRKRLQPYPIKFSPTKLPLVKFIAEEIIRENKNSR